MSIGLLNVLRKGNLSAEVATPTMSATHAKHQGSKGRGRDRWNDDAFDATTVTTGSALITPTEVKLCASDVLGGRANAMLGAS